MAGFASSSEQPARRRWWQRLLGWPSSPSARPVANAYDVYVGEIILVPYNFSPLGFLECNGQLLPISQYDVLFALIGTTYGGDGQSTFALPNLNSRVPTHQGQGPGLSGHVLGQAAGAEHHTLSATQMPAHNHGLTGTSAAGTQTSPAGALLANSGSGTAAYAGNGTTSNANATSVGISGGSQPHNNMQPYLGLKFCIAEYGVFPSRN